MLFKDLCTNYPVYALKHTGGNVSVIQGKVISISSPRLEPCKTDALKFQTSQMVLDVTIDFEGIQSTYVVPETYSVVYAPNLTLALDKADIIKAVESLKSKSENVIKSIDENQSIITNCDKILIELNPVFKEKKETDERLSKLETTMDNVSN